MSERVTKTIIDYQPIRKIFDSVKKYIDDNIKPIASLQKSKIICDALYKPIDLYGYSYNVYNPVYAIPSEIFNILWDSNCIGKFTYDGNMIIKIDNKETNGNDVEGSYIYKNIYYVYIINNDVIYRSLRLYKRIDNRGCRFIYDSCKDDINITFRGWGKYSINDVSSIDINPLNIKTVYYINIQTLCADNPDCDVVLGDSCYNLFSTNGNDKIMSTNESTIDDIYNSHGNYNRVGYVNDYIIAWSTSTGITKNGVDQFTSFCYRNVDLSVNIQGYQGGGIYIYSYENKDENTTSDMINKNSICNKFYNSGTHVANICSASKIKIKLGENIYNYKCKSSYITINGKKEWLLLTVEDSYYYVTDYIFQDKTERITNVSIEIELEKNNDGYDSCTYY